MQFGSLTFLYLFLPASLLVFNLVPKRLKSWALTGISAAFVALAQWKYFPLFAVNIIFQYAMSELMQKSAENPKKKRLIFTAAVSINTLMMVFFSVMNQINGMELPIGVMVISFTSTGYFVDVYKNETEYIHSFPELAAFLSFFGKLYRGPLVRAGQRKASPCAERFSLRETGKGLYLFLRGLAKYVLLALPLSQMYGDLSAAAISEISVVGAWMKTVTLGMMMFYDLSGFCDMARGLGRCFGIELPKNFYFPFQSPSVTDFLDRFNMTVTEFFRHYVYDNLRTKKDSAIQFIVDTLLICMLCGVWFGVRMNYVAWGLYIAAFIIIEGAFLRKALLKIPRIFARIYTFCITMLSMTIISTEERVGILPTFKAMIGVDTVAITDEVSYIISQNVLVLIIGMFFLTSAFSTVIRYISKKAPPLYNIFAVAEAAALLALITGELI